MNAEHLLAQFDRICESPDSIPRLRRFVLDLAIRGKLVPQNSKEKPALNFAFQGDPHGKDRIDMILPPHWVWARVEDVAEARLGKMLDKAKNSGQTFQYLRNTNVQWFDIRMDDLKELRIEPEEVEKFVLKPGDVLICEGGHPGRAAVWKNNEKGIIFQKALHRVRPGPHLNSDFFTFCMSTYFHSSVLNRFYTGVGIPHLTGVALSKLLFPLPPISEQNLIVARVHELMELCDRLEAVQAEREQRRDGLAAVSLHRLSQPTATLSTFRELAEFHLRHLPQLTARPEQISRLRQTILNLAVRGKFSPKSDWPANSDSVRKYANLQNGYAFKSQWFVKTGVRLLRNANVGHGTLRWDDSEYLAEIRIGEFARFQLLVDDVVLSLDRPFISTGTKVARIRPKDLPCLLLQRVGRFQPNPALLDSDYLFIWLNSPHFSEQIDPGRSNGVPHISSRQVESAQIFVPSLEEQIRVVNKVKKLLTLCDSLEKQLAFSLTEGRRFLESVLHKALHPAP